MAKKNPRVTALESVVRQLGKAKPTKGLELLDGAFQIFAAAGQKARAASIIELACSLPLPRQHYHAFGTGPMDGFCAVAKLGDLTRGEPLAGHLRAGMSLAERVRASELLVRDRLTSADGARASKGPWSGLSGGRLLLAVKALARPAKDGAPAKMENEALAAMTRYMDAWCKDPEDRGAGYGEEVALAFDLALRHGAATAVARWVPVLGPHMLQWGIAEALCLPRVAKAIMDGLLVPVAELPTADAKRLHDTIAKAVHGLAATAKAGVKLPAPMKPGAKPARREVDAEYSQFYLQHATVPDGEVCFQDRRESPQGMSLFKTHAGIATPADTGECIVELALANGKPAPVDLATQAVAFPFTVTGPLHVRSVSGGGEDEDSEIVVPHGEYDVLARFLPKRAPKGGAGLRSFRVTLDFHPRGALKAPRCIKLDFGKPPKTIFRNGA